MARVPFNPSKHYSVCAVDQKPYLYDELRVDKDTVPDDLHIYECADFDGTGRISRIKEHIMVDFFATIIGKEELDLLEDHVYYPRLDNEYDIERNAFMDALDADESLSADECDAKRAEYDEQHFPDKDEFCYLGMELTPQEYLDRYDELKESIESINSIEEETKEP